MNNDHLISHAHPTIAGNLLDPHVEQLGAKSGFGYDGAAGNVSSSGYGTAGPAAGEPSLREQHEGGIQHVKDQSGLGAGTSAQQGHGSGSEAFGTNAGTSAQQSYGSGAEANSTYSTSTGSEPIRNTAAKAEATPNDRQPDKDHSTNAGESKAKGHFAHKEGGGYIPTETEANNDSDGKGGPPASIPTAGGERIGAKHWGESKIIPEVPKRRESAEDTTKKGVSSAAGQSDDLTKKNTASNAGDAVSGEKESTMDKIKDALHIGHK